MYGQEQVIANNENIGNYYIDEEKYQELISCAIAPHDILISLVGTVGKVLVLSDNCLPGIINPRLIEDKKRLEIMPYFEVRICGNITDFHECIHLALSSQNAENGTVIDQRISIKNIGLGPAKDIRYTWNNLDGEYDRNDLEFTAILPGENKDVNIDFYAEHKDDFSEYVAPVSIILTYCDLLENKYHLSIDFVFTISTEDNVKLTKYTVGTPSVVKE